MIGNGSVPSWSFKWYAHYMEHGYKDAEVRPDRVEWVETRNLPTNNMHAGARIMAATFRLLGSVSVPRPRDGDSRTWCLVEGCGGVDPGIAVRLWPHSPQ